MKKTLCLSLTLLLCHAVASADSPSASSWTQFRGTAGNGHAATTGVPFEWSEKESVSWKTPLPGRGYSSPVIEDDVLWMTTALETEANEEERKRLLKGNTGSQPLTTLAKLDLHAIGVDKKSGKLLHDIPLLSVKYPDPIHNLNSFASPTPVIAGGRLYCHFGTFGTACVDTKTQKVLWKNEELHLKHENGPGSSPIFWKDHVIFHCDGSDVQYIAALHKDTGKLVWKTDRSGEMHSNPQLKKAYGTPHIVKIKGKDVLTSPAANWLYGYDPQSGKELWKVAYGDLGFSIVPRPIVGHGMIFMCTSFMKSQLIAFKYEGKDVPEIAWRRKKSVPSMSSPILVGDLIYFVNDKGIATCLEATSGTQVWSNRLGGNYSASPILVDGRLYFSNREGVTTVIKPGREFKVLAKNELDGRHMASLIALDGSLFARTDKAIYKID